MSKTKVVKKHVYKKDVFELQRLPLMRHLPKEVVVDSAFVMEVGEYSDGSVYQVIKVNMHEGVIR